MVLTGSKHRVRFLPLASLTIEVGSIMLCPSHAFIDAVMSSILLETKDRPLV
jgi:hypothetical protein